MKLIWKILIPIGVIIVVPVVAAYACFFDSTSTNITYDESFDTENYFSDTLVKSLNDSRTTHKMNLEITKDDLNNFLHKTLTSDNGIPTQYVNPIYLDIDGNNYIFNVGLNVPMFQTRLKLTTHLDVIKDSTGADVYTFVIDDCKLGRIGGLYSFGISIASNFISDSQLEQTLADSGIHATVNLKEGKISYPETILLSDIQALTKEQSNDTTDLLMSCMEDFLTNDYLTLNPKDEISLSLDLEKLSTNEYRDTSKEQNLDLDSCVSKVKTLGSSSIIDSDHYQNVYQYLIYGYDNSASEVQDYLADKDFSSVGISDVKTYAGIAKKSNRSITDVIGDQVVSIADLALTKNITFMTESQLNEYVSGKGFIGYSYLLVDSKKETVNYITVDNFYSNLYSVDGTGHMILTAGLSFNGYETSLSFDFKQDTTLTHDYQMGFDLEKIKFGEYQACDKLSEYLFNLIGNSLSGDSTIKVDSTAKTVVVDFSDSIDDITKAAVNMLGSPHMSIEGDGLSDDTGRVRAYIS